MRRDFAAVILLVAAAAGFYFGPGIMEPADTPCDALVSRRLAIDPPRDDNDQADRIASGMARVLGPMFLKRVVERRYPNVPPQLACAYLYWQSQVDPQYFRQAAPDDTSGASAGAPTEFHGKPTALKGTADSVQGAFVTAWQALNEDCRGGHGDYPATQKACDRREVIDDELRSQGCQYHEGGYWTCNRGREPEPGPPRAAAGVVQEQTTSQPGVSSQPEADAIWKSCGWSPRAPPCPATQYTAPAVRPSGGPQDNGAAVAPAPASATPSPAPAAQEKQSIEEEGKIYAIFFCMTYTATPQMNSCRFESHVNGGAYYQSLEECERTMVAYKLPKVYQDNAGGRSGWLCMGKPGWRPVQ